MLNKKMLIIFGVIILIVVVGFWFLMFWKGNYKTTDVSFVEKDIVVSAEVMKTPADWMKGLMGRDLLLENQGMLFIFPFEAPQSFWMKNVKFPIDIIFFSKDKQVVDIKENFEPCQSEPCQSYKSKKPAKYVLEVNNGFSKQWNIQIGDKISF